jgi:hypothetical protein
MVGGVNLALNSRKSFLRPGQGLTVLPRLAPEIHQIILSQVVCV